MSIVDFVPEAQFSEGEHIENNKLTDIFINLANPVRSETL